MKAVIVSPSEYGIEEKKADELVGNLPQIIKEREELEKHYNEVIKLDIEEDETTKQAKELRLLIQKNRTQGINVWHKTTKDFFLKGGQFVDAIKRKEIAVNERMESELLAIEKHAEIKEQKRLEQLQVDRVKMISDYVDDSHLLDLSSLPDDVWEAYCTSMKKQYHERIAAEKKAEEERIAKEKAEAVERERLRIENEKLKQEAEAREKQQRYEEEIRAENERIRIMNEERERQVRQEQAKKKLEAEKRKQQREYEAKLKKEREEKDRLESEIKAKEEAERRAKEEEEAARQRELEKGDAEKVNDLIADLNSIKGKYVFDSQHNKKMLENVELLINQIINFIQD